MLERRRCAGREPEATPWDSSSSLRDAVDDDDDSSECRVGDLRSERVGDDSEEWGRS